ncbi:hypothetical protein K4F52_000606 [Lecanicillium sp. MT-2017a]|nr:hypothetical protein K4F52_000606 [Lecanicillium sp. MT-2017a]
MSTNTEALTQAFNAIESRFQAAGFSDDKWYILAITCITASPDPEAAGHLYTHLTSRPDCATPESRQHLVRRLREALVKAASVVGIPKPIESILSISKVEAPADRDYSCTREGWRNDEANTARGKAWFGTLYARNATDTMGLFDAHRDFALLSTDITYGLYLSDRQVLGDVDTQLVVLPALMMQNLGMESHWHIRGTRRLGVGRREVEVVCECVGLLAGVFGVRMDKVPAVKDVEYDV